MYFDIQACGERISDLRKAHSMSQFQLGIKLNITDGHVCKLEKGLRGPSIDLLIDISELFQVSLDYLILGKEKYSKASQVLNEAEAASDHIQQILHLLNP